MAGFCLGKFSVTLGDSRNLNQKNWIMDKKVKPSEFTKFTTATKI